MAVNYLHIGRATYRVRIGMRVLDSSVVGYDGGWNGRDEEQRVVAETGPPAGGSEARSEERSSIILRKAVGPAAVVLVLVIILIVYGYTGKPGSGWIGVAHKRFWDYLDLFTYQPH